METWTPFATILMGFASQWLFGIKRIPSSATYAVIVALAIVLYLMGCDCKPTWDRAFFLSAGGWVLMIVQAIRGSAGMSKDAKAAPKTDSL